MGQHPQISIVIPVRNASVQALRTAGRFLSAADVTSIAAEVVIVDDGSSVTEREILRTASDPRIRIIESEHNRGRSGAVNLGAENACAQLLLIVDCDCPPQFNDFFSQHLASLQSGADVSIGSLRRNNDSFWGMYQDLAVTRREQQFASGITFAFTSQNVLITTEAFHRVGGFDDTYHRYGFEDRDFFIRLVAAGAKLRYAPDAGVVHEDDNIRLASILPKMRDAGEFTSAQFRYRFPLQYRQLGYQLIDVRDRAWLKPLSSQLGQLAIAAGPRLDPWLSRLPFRVATLLTKLLVALAYMYGTFRAARASST